MDTVKITKAYAFGETMRNRKILISLFGAATFLVFVSVLRACSVTHVNSAAEITQQAEVIVRAQVVGYKKENEYGGKVEFKVLEVIKGEFKQGTFTLPGQTERYEGGNDQKPPYNFVRKGGRHGNCRASDYKMNGEFLLFLRNNSATWSALAATNEEVSGENDPWVWWVKGYLAATTRKASTEKT